MTNQCQISHYHTNNKTLGHVTWGVMSSDNFVSVWSFITSCEWAVTPYHLSLNRSMFWLIYTNSTWVHMGGEDFEPTRRWRGVVEKWTMGLAGNYFEEGLGGLGVTCSPRDSRFAGSNPAEVDGFFQDVKILSTGPPGGTSSWESRVWDFRLVKEPQAWKNRPLSKI